MKLGTASSWLSAPLMRQVPERMAVQYRCKFCGRKLELGQHCTHVVAEDANATR